MLGSVTTDLRPLDDEAQETQGAGKICGPNSSTDCNLLASQFPIDGPKDMIFDDNPRQNRFRAILGCALVGSIGILILDTLISFFNVYYYSDNILTLYPVAERNLIQSLRIFIRPLEFLIVLAANNIYLPLWLGVSLLCTVGATILSALACELVFERQLRELGWWILGLANPTLFYANTQATVVSQALSNLLFAGALFAFVFELRRQTGRLPSGWRADRASVFLNLMAAAMFFTKETVVAGGIVLPAASALIRLRARRLSPIFLFSLLLPIIAAISWFVLKLKFPSMFPEMGEERYDLKLNPIIWVQNLVVTLAFPITPLPTSSIGFALLRPVWVVVALGSVILFLGNLLRETLRQPKVIFPLLVIVASLAPLILVRSSELYASMIAPFVVSIALLSGLSNKPRLALVYGVLLYVASLVNGMIYCLGADFNPFGLERLRYSIYGQEYQFYPICPIATTAHVGWDGTAVGEVPLPPGLPFGVQGKFICIQ